MKLPKVAVPVTVTTDGMDKGVSEVEAKLGKVTKAAEKAARSTARVTKAATSPAGAAGPSPKASNLTAAIGGASGLGPLSGLFGASGAVGLAASIPFALAAYGDRSARAMASMTSGAGDALASFRRTGQQSFTTNGVMLERLAALEPAYRNLDKQPGFMEMVDLATSRPGKVGALTNLSNTVKASIYSMSRNGSGAAYNEGMSLLTNDNYEAIRLRNAAMVMSGGWSAQSTAGGGSGPSASWFSAPGDSGADIREMREQIKLQSNKNRNRV